MRDETKLDVYTSGITGAEYDAGMKHLMSNKEIMSGKTPEEVADMLNLPLEEIKKVQEEQMIVNK